ncbi:alpha/beta hydrolase family protein [Actinomadura roseirufa]|uniref:alpha/beta hydrolase family protein n=1 Tax=Actinomadura roseirufa TaxID=2094049 RepID=UPI001041B751|nr:alpha/beta fold hydrolase [Actinomadura roseirufa]
MKFLFEDASFSLETLRTASFAPYGGADLGEVIVTAGAIPDGDEDAWYREWRATAARVHELGDRALAAGHRVSGREALLRASNYYRTADFYLRDDPFNDVRVKELSGLARGTFAAAAEHMDSPVEPVVIPYEETTLPGYLFLVDDSGTPRPTVVFTSGFDSILQEAYFAVAAAALRRGYHCLAYDGPGQGAALREQRLFFRPDWEAVITPVLDYALARPEIDPDRVVLYGYSFGGHLVPRAAAFEHRAAALVLDDGLYSYFDASTRMYPPWLLQWILDGRDTDAEHVLSMLMTVNTAMRWALRNGVWTFGADSIPDYVRRSRPYTLDGVVQRITTPALIFDPDDDLFFKGEPARLHQALGDSSTLITLPSAEGLGEHCSYGGRSTLHQCMYDWLDQTL